MSISGGIVVRETCGIKKHGINVQWFLTMMTMQEFLALFHGDCSGLYFVKDVGI